MAKCGVSLDKTSKLIFKQPTGVLYVKKTFVSNLTTSKHSHCQSSVGGVYDKEESKRSLSSECNDVFVRVWILKKHIDTR